MLSAMCLLPLGCHRKPAPPRTPQEKAFAAVSEKVEKAASEEDRFHALNDASRVAYNCDMMDAARRYAEELLRLAPKYATSWDYGNALQNGNIVLGRIALREGRVDEAKRRLLEAGKSPGSPQMDTFGPDITLAMELVAKGEKDVVLEYFDLCRKFWKTGLARLDRWSQQIRDGKAPDFDFSLEK